MAFYYDVTRAFTSNGGANTCSSHYRLLTVANQANCNVVQIMVNSRFGTAGGAQLDVRVYAQGTLAGGTTRTPSKKNPNSPAAQTTAADDATAFTSFPTVTVRESIGFAQTGGNNGWTAVDPNDAYQLLPNGGANGNIELASSCTTASVTGNLSCEFTE